MADTTRDDASHPNLASTLTGVPQTAGSSSACSGALTLCTIASSVSNLAVTEDSFPLSDQDMCWCPPKKIRISEHGDSIQTSSCHQHCERVDQPHLENSIDIVGRRGKHWGDKLWKSPDHPSRIKLPSNVWNTCPPVNFAGSVNIESDLSGMELEKVMNKKIPRCKNTEESNGCPSESDSLHSHKKNPEEWKKLKQRSLSCDAEALRGRSTLSDSPFHSHVIDSKQAVWCEDQSSHHDRNMEELQWKAVGSSGDTCGYFQGSKDTVPQLLSSSETERITDQHGSERDTTMLHLSCAEGFSDHNRGNNIHSTCCEGLAERAVPFTGAQAADRIWDLHSECGALQATGAHKSVAFQDTATTQPENDSTSQPSHTDNRKVLSSLGLSQNVKVTSSQSIRVDSHFSPGVHCDADSPSSSKSTSFLAPNSDCGTSRTFMLAASMGCYKEGILVPMTNTDYETDRVPALTSNTDDETDSSGCSEACSSDTSSSSSESSPHQSSVASARIFHHKFQCGRPQYKNQGKSRQMKKTPRYGLKSDAVDDLIGVRRSGHSKNKQQLCASSSSELNSSENRVMVKDDLTINDLPAVLLIHIFSFLPIITRIRCIGPVCKKWQLLVVDSSLWRHLDLRNLPRLKDDKLLQLTSLSDRVSSLILSDGQSTLLTDQGVSRVLQKCQHLTKVKLNRCFFLSDDAFQNIGKHCHGLVYLNLSGCFTVTDKTLLAISEGCPQLQVLGLGQCARITDEGVCAVARGCPCMISFHLNQCGKLTNKAVETIASRCPDMQFLHLLSCALTDEGISHLSKLGNLQVLDISNVSQLSPRTVEAVVACCPLLETLALSLNRAVDNNCLGQVVIRCPKLRCLSCVACGLSDPGLHHIAKHAKNLERLDVAWCADITNAGITEVSDACPKLRYLGIMRCPLVTMATVERLQLTHPSIHYSNFELESRRLLGRAAEQGLTTS